MCTSAPKAPKPPPPPPPPAHEAEAVTKDPAGGGINDARRRMRAKMAGGAGGTILTGPAGITGAASTGKTVLG
jgi:hypothetical protein